MNIYTIVKTTYNKDEDGNAIMDSIYLVESIDSYGSQQDANFECKEYNSNRSTQEQYYVFFDIVTTNLY